MTWIDRIHLFSAWDVGALCVLFLTWFFIGLVIENAPNSRPSTSQVMTRYRREWMQNMAARDNRIFDAQIMNGLRQGTSFFASASMIAIGGLFAMISNADRFVGLASELTLSKDPQVVWEIKLFIVLFFVTNAFLKFVWSHRLFGYCAIVMASVPNDPDDPLTPGRAAQSGRIKHNGCAQLQSRIAVCIFFNLFVVLAGWPSCADRCDSGHIGRAMETRVFIAIT